MRSSHPQYAPHLLTEITKLRKNEKRLETLEKNSLSKNLIKRQLLTKECSERNIIPSNAPKHPLDIIHEEGVWTEILSYLNNSEDVINAYYSCSLFHNLLQKKVINVLFPLVLDVLDKLGYLSYRNYSDRNAILALRLVSKSVREAVEKVYFEDRYQVPDWHIQYESCWPLRSPISSSKKVEQIISSLTENHFLFTRELTIVDPFRVNEIALNEFHIAVTNLLEICGESIWALVYHTRRPFRTAYNSVREWCELMPNLRVLRVKNLRGFNQDDAYIDDDMRTENMMLQFEMRQNPFPSMAHLEHYEGTDLPCAFSSEILRSNSDIKSIAVSEINFEMSRIIVSMRLDRLSLFKFQHHTTTYFISNPGTKSFDWPLRKISLQYTRGNMCCRMIPLFQFLNNYGDSLEELDVGLDFEDDCDSAYLELPKLKTLKWKINKVMPSIDFIIPLGKLEIVHFSFENSDLLNEGRFRFNEQIISLSDCNFWNCFPNLKKVCLESTQRDVRRTLMRI